MDLRQQLRIFTGVSGASLNIVIPSLDLVIARTGKVAPAALKWRPDWNGDYAIIEPFLTPIVASVEE